MTTKDVEVNRSMPEDVLRNILARLPIKTCLNFKLVCKAWYNTIMDPYFSTNFRRYRHTLLFSSPPNFSTSLGDNPANFILVDLQITSHVLESGYLKVDGDDYNTITKPDLDYPRKTSLGNVCNGLICYRINGDSNFYVRNLMTNQTVTVKGPYWDYDEYLCLGFSSLSLRFKLLRVARVGKFNTVRYMAEIKTIGVDDEWRSVGVAPSGLRMHPHTPIVNDSIHWYDKVDVSIWSFDFEKEEFSQVLLPHEIDTAHKHRIELTAFESTLCLCYCYLDDDSYLPRDDYREIWVMKEYGVRDSWVKQWVIFTGNYESIYLPLMEINSGEVLMRRNNGFSIYNPKSGRLRNLTLDWLNYGMVSWSYGVSFPKYS